MEQQDIDLEINREFVLNDVQQGTDMMGNNYQNINDMWEKELDKNNGKKVSNAIGGKDNWYNKAAEYWQNVDASIEGVLGGYGCLDSPDISHSQMFVKQLFQQFNVGNKRAIDMGAGIGRISKGLLCKNFETVDVLDQCEKYVEKAKEYLQGENVGHFIASGLQNVQFQEKYDCIWVQWVSHHLTDADFIKFLVDCKSALNPNGVVVFKENHTKQGFIVDKEDYSVTRDENLYRQIFDKAGYSVLMDSVQTNFPKELFLVKAYALVPK